METQSIWEVVLQGGIVMWILLVFSVGVIAAAVERIIVLRRAELDLAPFIHKLERALVHQRSPADALRLCRDASGAAAAVGASGLRRFDLSIGRLEKAIERQGAAQLRRLQRRMGVFSTVAVAAPLLGFLGTVVGMMVSFKALADFGQTNPGLVALGINQALATTAAGLVVALPAQLLHNYFSTRVERIAGAMETVGYVLLEARADAGAPARVAQ